MHSNDPIGTFCFFCHILPSLFLFCQNWWLYPCPLSLDSSLPIMSFIQSISSSHQPLALAGFPFYFACLPFALTSTHTSHTFIIMHLNQPSGCLNYPFDKYLLDACHCPKHCPKPGVESATVQICLVLRDFPKCRTFSGKTGTVLGKLGQVVTQVGFRIWQDLLSALR